MKSRALRQQSRKGKEFTINKKNSNVGTDVNNTSSVLPAKNKCSSPLNKGKQKKRINTVKTSRNCPTKEIKRKNTAKLSSEDNTKTSMIVKGKQSTLQNESLGSNSILPTDVNRNDKNTLVPCNKAKARLNDAKVAGNNNENSNNAYIRNTRKAIKKIKRNAKKRRKGVNKNVENKPEKTCSEIALSNSGNYDINVCHVSSNFESDEQAAQGTVICWMCNQYVQNSKSRISSLPGTSLKSFLPQPASTQGTRELINCATRYSNNMSFTLPSNIKPDACNSCSILMANYCKSVWAWENVKFQLDRQTIEISNAMKRETPLGEDETVSSVPNEHHAVMKKFKEEFLRKGPEKLYPQVVLRKLLVPAPKTFVQNLQTGENEQAEDDNITDIEVMGRVETETIQENNIYESCSKNIQTESEKNYCNEDKAVQTEIEDNNHDETLAKSEDIKKNKKSKQRKSKVTVGNVLIKQGKKRYYYPLIRSITRDGCLPCVKLCACKIEKKRKIKTPKLKGYRAPSSTPELVELSDDDEEQNKGTNESNSQRLPSQNLTKSAELSESPVHFIDITQEVEPNHCFYNIVTDNSLHAENHIADEFPMPLINKEGTYAPSVQGSTSAKNDSITGISEELIFSLDSPFSLAEIEVMCHTPEPECVAPPNNDSLTSPICNASVETENYSSLDYTGCITIETRSSPEHESFEDLIVLPQSTLSQEEHNEFSVNNSLPKPVLTLSYTEPTYLEQNNSFVTVDVTSSIEDQCVAFVPEQESQPLTHPSSESSEVINYSINETDTSILFTSEAVNDTLTGQTSLCFTTIAEESSFGHTDNPYSIQTMNANFQSTITFPVDNPEAIDTPLTLSSPQLESELVCSEIEQNFCAEVANYTNSETPQFTESNAVNTPYSVTSNNISDFSCMQDNPLQNPLTYSESILVSQTDHQTGTPIIQPITSQPTQFALPLSPEEGTSLYASECGITSQKMKIPLPPPPQPLFNFFLGETPLLKTHKSKSGQYSESFQSPVCFQSFPNAQIGLTNVFNNEGVGDNGAGDVVIEVASGDLSEVLETLNNNVSQVARTDPNNESSKDITQTEKVELRVSEVEADNLSGLADTETVNDVSKLNQSKGNYPYQLRANRRKRKIL